MPDITSTVELSALTSTVELSAQVLASPYLMDCLAHGMSVQECERRVLAARRLKEEFSSLPFHAQKAAKDPDYWLKLSASAARY